MSLPEVVTDRLDDERPVAEVDLGGEDHLYVTPTRTLIYRAEGLLSDETVEEYPHAAERIVLAEGRRKAKVTMAYGLDGEETFAVPKGKLEEALHPIIAGVLNAAGITDPGETVKRTFRFSELTLVVTSDRVVKHIGQAVWDEDYEEYHFEDVTDLTFEHGNVATSVVLTLDDRQERFKAPNEEARAVEEAITAAVLDYHGVDDVDALRALSADEDEDESTDERRTDPFGDGPDLLSTGSDEDEDTSTAIDPLTDDGADVADSAETTAAGAVEQVADDGFEPATRSVADAPAEDADVEALATEVRALRRTVEQQRAQLERQSDLVEQLIEELRQGR